MIRKHISNNVFPSGRRSSRLRAENCRKTSNFDVKMTLERTASASPEKN